MAYTHTHKIIILFIYTVKFMDHNCAINKLHFTFVVVAPMLHIRKASFKAISKIEILLSPKGTILSHPKILTSLDKQINTQR